MKPLLFAAAALLATAPLSLASVSISASGNLSSSTDPVANAFNGAHFNLTATFTASTYQDDGEGNAAAISDPAQTKLTITGASNPAYNGTFSLYPTFGTAYYYPTYAGIYGAPANTGFLYFQVGTDHYLEVSVFAPATPTGSTKTIGSPIAASDFSNGAFVAPADPIDTTFKFGVSGGGPEGSLTITGGTFSTVPETTAPALLALGLVSFGLRRRR